ncbi:uncharacterized protein LOC143280477 [Babylonia areolata]|uniref:uncharacterized protein LOC143280477 n=1 Tax=Babylonia areolata TaxID=304850 RepID=UPI003FD5EA5B
MASRTDSSGGGDELDKMADSLRAEVAQQYNMSVRDYFSQLVEAVSPGPADGKKGNGTGEEAVEISKGVAWTLVAPLVMLAVLVMVGVTAACLWRIKDRRCPGGTGSRQREVPRAADHSPGDIEMQELHREVHQGPPGPAGGRVPGVGHPLHEPFERHDSVGRPRYPGEGEHHHHHHHRHTAFSRDRGMQDKRGIQLLSQDAPSQEIPGTNGPDMAKCAPGPGSAHDVHQAGPEKAVHLAGVGDVGKELYCAMCQHYMAHHLQNNIYYHSTQHLPSQGVAQHHPHLQHGHSDGATHVLGMPDGFHCRQCAAGPGGGHHHHQLLCHDPGVRPTPPHERQRLASHSLDDHLHLAPRYQPPHPATLHPRGDLQDPAHQRLLQHSHDEVHDLTLPDLSPSSHTRGSYHGLENPLFSADADNVEPGSSASCGESCTVNGQPGGGTGEKGSSHRIINSTSMMSTQGGHSDPTQSGQGRHHTRRRHSVAHRKSAVVGPDVSSIKMMSSVSLAWRRASCHLLPSTTTASSSDTPSYHTTIHSGTDDDDEEEDSEDDEPETLSLPSSISRFHASRVQFPPLMPDAQYPLTSTKAFYSPSWPGEGQPNSAEANILEALENFSDNTSMQPNVGSSVTSGHVSDLRGSQTVSSSISESWGAPVDFRPPQSSPAQQADKQGLPDETKERTAETAHSEQACKEADRTAEDANRGRGSHQQDQVCGDGTGNQNDAQNADKDNEEKVMVNPGSPGPTPRARHRKEPSSPHIPKSASELHRARILKGKKRKEKITSEHKQGFFLIPRQDTRSGADTCAHPQTAVNVSSVGMSSPAMASPQYLVSPSGCQVTSRHPAHRKHQVSVHQENVGHQTHRHRPSTPGESRTSKAGDFLVSADSQPYQGSMDLNGKRKTMKSEPHPAKLFSCKPPATLAEQNHPPTCQGTPARLKEASSVTGGNIGNYGYGYDRIVQSSKYGFSTTYPVPHLMGFKASAMSASFPAVNHEAGVDASFCPQRMASTLDNRSSKVSRTKLKRVRSQEDHAYINMGGSFFDELLHGGRNRNVPPSLVQSGDRHNPHANLQPKPEPSQQMTLPQASQQVPHSPKGQVNDHRSLLSTRTDSQILAEVLSSFPRSSVSTDTTTTTTTNQQDQDRGRQQLGTVYTDVTIPTAFADELFGIWSLTPELDDNLSPSQPRTPLMTPLKEEERRANRKFIWGNSGSPSASTSTSSFAAGWPLFDDFSADTRRRNVSRQIPVDNEFDDYVHMDKNSSDQRRSAFGRMSISDSPSGDTMPPTPTVRDAPEKADLENANDPSTMDEYKSLPLNNLNVSHLYVISGYPDKDSVNNNALTDLADTGHFVTNVASTPQSNAIASVVNADVQNRNSPTAAFAIVLEKQKYWL